MQVVTYDLATGELHLLQAKAVLLATGGCGKVYKTTSNSNATTGEAFNMVYQLGIPLEDMEFIQFHPTGLYPLGILVSEAARGEGGVLRNGQGDRFMERYAPTIKDLAARDVVSRAILREIREGRGIRGKDYVHLDLTHLGEKKIQEKLWEILGDLAGEIAERLRPRVSGIPGTRVFLTIPAAIPIFLSAVIVFVASSIVHMVLPYHRSDLRQFTRQDEVLEALRAGAPGTMTSSCSTPALSSAAARWPGCW
jgi:hypothetical protein